MYSPEVVNWLSFRVEPATAISIYLPSPLENSSGLPSTTDLISSMVGRATDNGSTSHQQAETSAISRYLSCQRVGWDANASQCGSIYERIFLCAITRWQTHWLLARVESLLVSGGAKAIATSMNPKSGYYDRLMGPPERTSALPKLVERRSCGRCGAQTAQTSFTFRIELTPATRVELKIFGAVTPGRNRRETRIELQ
jgi:hypothetical protein